MASHLYRVLKKAQNGSEEHVIELYYKFLPLIKKYGRKLNYEESESDLTFFLLEYINKTDFDKFRNRNDGEIVNYFKLIFRNKYIDILRKLMNKKIETVIIEPEIIYYDRYKNLEDEYILSLLKSLNRLQKKIIIGRYIKGYSDNMLSEIFTALLTFYSKRLISPHWFIQSGWIPPGCDNSHVTSAVTYGGKGAFKLVTLNAGNTTLAQLKSKIDDGVPVLLRYKKSNLPSDQHWVVVYGYTGTGTSKSNFFKI